MAQIERIWPVVRWKKAASAILMIFRTLDLFLTRNRMEQVLGPKNDPLGVIQYWGVKGQYAQK
jgi:hypothetical protein